MSSSPSGRTLRSLDDLVRAGLIEPRHEPALADVADQYAIGLSAQMAATIDPDDPNDPIAAQFVPDAREAETRADECGDPIGDEAHAPCPGIVHRYPDRVLLKATAVCPVYCRFCFRREMVGPGHAEALTTDDLERAFAYIASHESIWEVVVTGGDPLALSPRRVLQIAQRLAAIAHVAVIRWHTRVPVVRSDLVSNALRDALAAPLEADTAVYVAVHANHAREFGRDAVAACRRLAGAGIGLAGQSVLLAGINDTPQALEALFRAMVKAGIRPYYLHTLDRAPGTAHFRVPIDRAQEVMAALRGNISGLCLPTLMAEIPGGGGKAAVSPSDARATSSGTTQLRDRNGQWHDIAT